MSTAAEKTFSVQGMICGHCEASVSEEVGLLAGVTSVRTDRATGELVVVGEGVEDAAVRAAVAEAGYEVVGS